MSGQRTSGPAALEGALEAAAAAQAANRLTEAAALLEGILREAPDHFPALCRYAIVALSARRPDVALRAAERAVAVDPDSPGAHNLRGVACRQTGRLADAIDAFRRAASLEPEFFDAQVNLGSALLDAGDTQAALPHYEKALAIDPRAASAHNNLGNLYRELRRPADAIAAYRRALELDPRHARAQANLGNVLKDLGEIDAAIAAYRSSLAIAPDAPEVWSDLLLTLNCRDGIDAESIADEHRAYGVHFARLIPSLPPQAGPRRPGRLRVGYVAADLRKHAVATFFVPLLEAHDRAALEIFCYYNQPRGDEVTERIRAQAEHFLPVSGIGDRELARRIRDDGIDILIDLTGHTAGNRLPLFFLRPARVQATWLGYLGGTGVPTMDWRLTDAHADPPQSAESPGLERPWRLPRTLWCYGPYPQAPDVSPLPADSRGRVTYACLNNPGKVSASALAAWRAILQSTPDSRLVLLTSPDAGRSAALRAYFADGGIEDSRIELVTRMPLADYLACYRRVDIALDTFPYNGGTTTCDACWMGVPVVTVAGNRPFARSGASILANLDLAELVTEDAAQYVATAVALARDRPRLGALRAVLRDRMRASPLTDAPGFARDFERALRQMHERGTRALPGEAR